jgi:outer membrane immunogenic protein
MTKFVLAGAVLALMGGAASAADLPAYEPAPVVAPVPSAFTWTGFYLGAHAGYSWGEGEINLGADEDEDFDADGWLAGGFVGFNYQFANPLVVGIEADLEWTSIDGDGSDAALGDFDADVNLQGSVRGRIGYAFDRVLPYLTAGFAAADVDADSDAFGDASDAEFGWTAGAGVDFAVTDKVFIRGEYRYTDLSDIDNDDDGGEVQDLQSHNVRLGVGVLF